MEDNPKTDPDAFAIASLAVSVVSMFAQFATIDFSRFRQPSVLPSGLTNSNTEQAFDYLKRAIEKSKVDVERLSIFLARSNEDGIRNVFRFGKAPLFFTDVEIGRIQELCAQLALDAAEVLRWSLQLLRIDPQFAESIKNKLIHDNQNIVESVRDIYEKPRSIEATLEQCRVLLSDFVLLLDNIAREDFGNSPLTL